MTLCSSVYNPLVAFTKHTYDDREVYRDRLISNTTEAGREGFRSRRHNGNAQVANESKDFNDPSPLFLSPYSGIRQLDIAREEPILTFQRSPDALAWSSEFQTNYSAAKNSPSARARSSYLADHSNSYSRDVGPPVTYGQVELGTPFSRCSLVGPLQSTAGAFQWKTNSRLVTAIQHQVPALKQQMLDDVDWETIFQSLEPAMLEADTQIEDIRSLEEQEVDQQEVALTIQTSHIEDGIRNPRDQLFSMRPVTNYNFQDENPFTAILNPFDEGMQIINNDGNLSLAALAFEAACQMDHSHLEAWRMLGSVQSENEREGAAIRALEEALNLEPANLDALIKLAVSYTNEGFDDRAYMCLEKWLRTKYSHIPINKFDPTSQFSEQRKTFECIKEAFIEAAQYSSTSDSIDPDVQVGLGVLLFSDDNYEMGADCFASAIHSITPGASIAESQLHLLWNRYAACLGNMGKYEEAIVAYEMALAIRPNFTRARCNLGLLYSSKNDAAMGARNILQALQAHRAAESQSKQEMLKIVKVGTSHGRLEEVTYGTAPSSIYESLKRCCKSLHRRDMAEAVGPNMDLRDFQKELDKL